MPRGFPLIRPSWEMEGRSNRRDMAIGGDCRNRLAPVIKGSPPLKIRPESAALNPLAWGYRRMAIYSCNLTSIGRTTHTAGTAGAHIRYISRPDASPTILSEHMPYDPAEARNWIDRAERGSRKNARVLDKIRIALPRELDEWERAALVEAYVADLAGGRDVPWYAAIHQSGKDAHNPHVHIAVHDRDMQTGKRVLRVSDSARDRRKDGLPGPKAVDWIRERWEIICNRALEQAGHEARIDRRTLEAQGVDREPTIHIGPRASHIDGNVKRPDSKRRVNGCGRVIDYPAIDKGQTRREFNAHIVDLNLERAARSDNPVTAAWAAFEKDQLEKDRALEDRLAAERRRGTAQHRNTANRYNAQASRVRAESRLKRREAGREVKARFDPLRETMRARHRKQREALKHKRSRFYMRFIAAIDITGTLKRRQREALKALSAIHKPERREFSERYQQAKDMAQGAVKHHYERKLEQVREERADCLAELEQFEKDAERQVDEKRQQREADREQARQITERKIQDWMKGRKQVSGAGKDDSRKDNALARAFNKANEQDKDRPQQRSGDRARTRGPS